MPVGGPVLWQALRPTRIWRIMPRMISSLRFGLRLLLGCFRPFMTASALYGQSRFCCTKHKAGIKQQATSSGLEVCKKQAANACSTYLLRSLLYIGH